jgi:hypothetical protein
MANKQTKKLKRFLVSMVGSATVSGSIQVEATDKQDAINKAAEMVGDVVWDYEGLTSIDEEYTTVRTEE